MRATDDGCWLYTGGRHPHGYGVIKQHGVSLLVHRIAYEIFIGELPDGLNVRHLCAERSCFNPAHLSVRDVSTRKRKPSECRGERHASSKLNPEKVDEIRRRHSAGETLAAIAKDHGISKQAVWNVAQRISWKHIA